MWKPLQHPMISDGYLISDKGHVRNKDCDEEYLSADYHSSNGYDFIMLIVKEEYRINNSLFMLFPIDELLGITFIPIPTELKDKPITIKHINGDTRDIDLSNLEWIEDIEEWRDCTYPNVKPGMYEVSSWGRVRNKITNDLLKPDTSKKGYRQVYLSRINGLKHVHTGIHRLMLLSFNSVNPDDMNNLQANHINGIKSYNILKNLEFVNNSTNQIHAYSLNINKVQRSISTDVVILIWMLLIDDPQSLRGRPNTNGSPMKVRDYVLEDINQDVGTSIIRGIKYGDVYKSITRTLPMKTFDNLHKKYNSQTKLTPDIVKLIWMLLIDDKGYIGSERTHGSPELVYRILVNMGITNVSQDDIQSIKSRKNWRHITDELPQPLNWDRECRNFSKSKMTEEIVKTIWLLLVDDPKTLKDDRPTNGSPMAVKRILESRGIDNVNENDIYSIKHKHTWSVITDKLCQKL